ncbi:bud32 protein kinase [Ophiostoma piceae UAMH 11346]|uniref:EKC/KEOPS complex subunit BUD32 n=1 Tax=Ophiostoma piceae (strain UAMH 11346) TaxID=1262450 RepID=S3CCY3_OPHP1|nr:bud32 protein kinase [Ophiostoma piceae UAMH 11346]
MAADPQPPAGTFALPRILAADAGSSKPILVAQGAEARVYKTTYLTPDRTCALKFRPPKAYRHPVLDARLTRQRILAEARILHKCRREGVPVPALYAVDIEDDTAGGRSGGGSLLTEWVEGGPVRHRINVWMAALPVLENAAADLEMLRAQPEVLALLRKMGTAVGSLHRVGVVHGDLTTSNLMLSTSGPADDADADLNGDVVIIDFGLASQSSSDEDRAVDLYVLERAFGSTHPRAEELFSEVLVAYGRTFKQAGPVLRKLEDVRMRGRKRSMLG